MGTMSATPPSPTWDEATAEQITEDLYVMAAAYRSIFNAPHISLSMTPTLWEMIQSKGVTDFPPGTTIRSSLPPYQIFRGAEYVPPV
jgi:hypothetical protein